MRSPASTIPLALACLFAACAPPPVERAVPAPAPVAPLADEGVRAIAALLEAEDRRAFDAAAIRAASGHAHPEVRRRAALAAGRIGDPRATAILLHMLEDADTAVAASAAFGLGLLADTTAVEALVARLAAGAVRDAPTVAGEAATALSRIDHPDVAVALSDFLRNTDASGDAVRLAVAPALLSFWRLPVGADRGGPRRWADHADPEVRFAAAHALFRRPVAASVDLALRLAADEDPHVRHLVLRGLAATVVGEEDRNAYAAAWRTVTERLLDADPMVRIAAIRAGATYRGAEAATLLARRLDDEPPVAVAAAEALGAMGSAAADQTGVFAEIARDAGRPVQLRGAAIEGLAAVSPAAARPLLEEARSAPQWRIRAAAARGTARIAQRAEELRPLVRDRDARVAVAAYSGLAVRAASGPAWGGTPALVRETLASARDVPLRAAALRALAPVAGAPDLPLVLDAYEAALADPEPDVARAALEVLGALRERDMPVSRGFALRFGPPGDPRIHRSALAAMPELAARWGEPGPVATGRDRGDYLALARGFVAAPRTASPYRARVETAAGAFEIELSAEAPLTVANFVELADRGYFDGQEWPRVVPAFVIQGGDPRGDTGGGPGYAIRDELNRLRYTRGAVGMALSGPDTGGSQFFVTHTPQPHLDGTYTVFGRVVSGMEVVDRTLAGDRIARVEIVSRPAPGSHDGTASP